MLRAFKFRSGSLSRTLRCGSVMCVVVFTLVAVGIRPAGTSTLSSAALSQEQPKLSATSVDRADAVSDWRSDPLAAVLNAWERNAKSMDTVACSWNELRVFMPGSCIDPTLIERLGLLADFPNMNRSVGWPDEVIKVSRTRSLRLQGRWMYLDDFSIGPAKEDLSAVVTQVISSNASKVSLRLSGGSGWLGEESSRSDFASVSWTPLRYFVRPFSRSLGGTGRNAWTVRASDATTGLITLSDTKGLELVFDTAKGFLIKEGQQVSPETGSPQWKFEVSLVKSDGDTWRPTGWELFYWNASGLQSPAMRFLATEFTWELNRTFEKKELTIQLPPGIPIYDSDGKLVTSIEP